MKNTLLFVCFFLGSAILNGQVITTDPIFPTESDSLKIIFNAAEGNRGLAGFTDDIWAHTGVLTDKSSTPGDWKYVIAGWSENTDKAKLTSLGNDLYELNITPNIRDFYGVPVGEKIENLAFVFRSSDGNTTGRDTDGGDIFTLVYEEGLNLTIVQPASDFFLTNPGEVFQIAASASFADSLAVFIDEDRLHATDGNSITYNLSSPEEGIHEVSVVAYAADLEVSDSFNFMVRGSGNIVDLPSGLKQGANYLDDQTVSLVLYAPGKEFVFAIGDFNEWQIDTDYLMNQTPDGSFFWINIDNLIPQQEYIYQYFVDGEIRIADPYTNKTSDPWNDSYIDEATYPGLIDYPAGKTSQIASVFQTEQEEYNWTLSEFEAPSKGQLVIYELLIRDFIADHSFLGLIDTLNYLQDLGVNAIELMPVSEFEGNDSWGYNTSFYFAVDKYYGQANTFKAFIDSAHQRGIAVIMDMVLNHTYGQSPFVRLYWDSQNNQPSSDNPWYNQTSPNSIFSWGYDLNHESEATKALVDSVNSFWLTEYKIDGFRFDFTKGFTNTPGDGGAYDASRIAILKRMNNRIREVNPDAYVLLEHFAENSEEKELAEDGMMIWGNMNHSYRIAVKGYLGGGASDLSWISYQDRGWDAPNLVGYMESHDEERLMVAAIEEGNSQNANHSVKELEIALKRMEISASFFIPIPGPKMIWMFGELGYDYSIDYNDRVGRKPIKWDYYNQHLRKRLNQVYGALAKLKQNYPVFQTDDYELVVRDTVKRIHLNHSDMNVTILGNFSTWTKLGQGGFQHDGWWYEYWTGDSLFVENTEAWLSFEPSEYRLYTDIKLDMPDVLSGIDNLISADLNGGFLKIYPNPICDQLFIELPFSSVVTEIEVISVDGKVLNADFSKNSSQRVIRLDSSQWPDGILFVRVRAGGKVWVEKIVK
ncbi:MAG: T9SS type A sorting domain-containing protein [Bacteroidales bacterium]|nr:T9SS type A sorting domain-containing protein [Bacteroidales bacterium]